MVQAISFDYQNTLVKTNPYFQDARWKLVNQFLPEMTKGKWLIRLNEFTEDYRVKYLKGESLPTLVSTYSELFPTLSDKDLVSMIGYTEDLFLQYPPIPRRATKFLVDELMRYNVAIFISCNSFLITPHTLKKTIFNDYGIISKNCRFSVEEKIGKPSAEMFYAEFDEIIPEIHVSRDREIDGKCINHGMEFLHINEVSDFFHLLDRVKADD